MTEHPTEENRSIHTKVNAADRTLDTKDKVDVPQSSHLPEHKLLSISSSSDIAAAEPLKSRSLHMGTVTSQLLPD